MGRNLHADFVRKVNGPKHLATLSKKPYAAVQWNVFEVVALLKNYAKMKDKESGCSLHSQITGNAFVEHNILVGTALVNMYAKCGMLKKAQEVFNSFATPDVVLWNALISGYAQQGHGFEALGCFEQMKGQKGVFPDEITFACSLKACGIVKDVGKGEAIHSEVDKEGLVKGSQLVGNALIDMYAKCGSLVKAQQVFDSLPIQDLVSWNALISGYVQNERGEDALSCFEQMLQKELSPNAVTFACVLKACGSIGGRFRGQEIHCMIEKTGFLRKDQLVCNALIDMYGKVGMLVKSQQLFIDLQTRDIISWNALITGYVHQNRGEEAIEFFEQMRRHGLTPSAVTFTCCLKACGSIGATEKTREVHAYLENSGLLKKSQVVGNALVDVYAKCGVVAKAQEVFDLLPSHNVVSWNSLITGYAYLGSMEAVIMNLNRMRGEGCEPNLVTFHIVLNACRHAGLVDKVHTYFEAISQSFGVSLLMKQQNCVIDLLSRAGQVDIALAMMRDAPSHPSNVMWLTVLSACRKWGDKNLGDKAFEQAIQLGDSQASTYVTLYNVYADTSLQTET
ncbi:hypothetical protein KP509_25G036300 [Ceratopteris richardii]|uniref:Pentatricopeptide repeat-containing protein n=1 Tax=Ceratopteris richardii TaxID=49495 RepID=A0A8T2RP90_CERRI|nr:hypothetical protein KP509_25G036300 [Ceratopteris richardii]